MTDPAGASEAEALLRGAVRLRQRRHGDHAPETIMTRINWACSLIRLARWSEAEEQLAITERTIAGLPEAGLDLVLMQANTQSALYRHLKKLPDAERVLRTGLVPVRERLEPSHVYRVTLEENLAVLLEEQGKLAPARAMLREAERHLRRVPSAHERTWQLLQAEWVALSEELSWSWEAAWWRAFRCPAKP